MKNKVKESKINLQLIKNEFVFGAFIAFFIGVIFYVLSLVKGIKNYDSSFTNFLNGSGIILMIIGIIVVILSIIYNVLKEKFNVASDEKIDTNIIIAVCPKCKNKFTATPKKIDDFIVIECSHCGVKLKKVDNKSK